MPQSMLYKLLRTVLPAIFMIALLPLVARADTFTVTDSGDSGMGTLRDAIVQANTRPGVDTIRFALPPGETRIAPVEPLPAVTDAVTIDGLTQTYPDTRPLITVSGESLPDSNADGLTISAPNVVLRGLRLVRFARAAVYITGASARVEDMEIGFDRESLFPQGATTGIESDGATGLVVQRVAVTACAIGIQIMDGDATTQVRNSLFGTTPDGDPPYGCETGVQVIGGSGVVVEGNIFAANMTGVEVTQGSANAVLRSNTFGLTAFGDFLPNLLDSIAVTYGATGTQVENNLIVLSGLSGIRVAWNANGTVLRGNGILGGVFGVSVESGATGTRIGTNIDTEANDIEGAANAGVWLAADGGSGTRIEANDIVGSGDVGVRAERSGATIAHNRITGSGTDGIWVAATVNQVRISENAIFANGDLGIRLVGRRPVGPVGNNGQLAPNIGQVLSQEGVPTRVLGTLTGVTPNTTFRVEFFALSEPDPSGEGEGERFIGSVAVTSDGSGNAVWVASGLDSVPTGDYVSATTTDASGNTSGFSKAIAGETVPAPTITALSPDTMPVGSPAFDLAVRGTGFVPGSTIYWNGAARTTTYISSTELRARIGAADIVNAGLASVTVGTPPPGGGVSAPLQFTITNPTPSLASLSPNHALAGSPAITVTLTGGNFVAGSKVRWNGSERTTTYVSATELRAAITSGDLAAPGSYAITVATPGPGGGETAPQTFTVENPVPTILQLSPSTVFAGNSAITVTISGANFLPGCVASWNGSPRQTTYLSPTQVTMALSREDLANPGLFSVTVTNPAPGGGASNSARFMVSGVPQIALASASVSRNGNAIQVSVQVKNTGSIALTGGQIQLADLSGTATTSPLPLPLPSLAAGATSATLTFTFPGGISAGRKVFSMTVRAGGNTLSASRAVTVP